ncbi:MAG: hypothetical protein U0821_03600 [Chloroflexota bacterium]
MPEWTITLREDRGRTQLRLRVPARAAMFTFSHLAPFGHPAHLAVIDSHLKGEIHYPPGYAMGADSRSVGTAIIGLLAAIWSARIPTTTLATVRRIESEAGSARYVVQTEPDYWRQIVCGEETTLATPWLRARVDLGRGGAGAVATVEVTGNADAANVLASPAPLHLAPDGRTRVVFPESDGPIEAAWERTWREVERLVQRPAPERRSDEVALEASAEGFTARLLVGWSLVLPRNPHLLAAWLGSDGSLQVRDHAT